MAFGNGRCKLTNRRNGDITNSTKSCQILFDSAKGGYHSAYSYRQKIAYIDHGREYILFNFYNFSVTTTSHQSGLYSKLRNMFPNYKMFTVSAGSINDFDGKSIESIRDQVSYTEGLAKFVEFLTPSGPGNKSFLEKIEKETNDRAERAREVKNEASRANRLRKKIINLDYKTERALVKAIGIYRDLRPTSNIRIQNQVSVEAVEKFSQVLSENKIDIRDWETNCLHRLRLSPEKLEAIIEDRLKQNDSFSFSLSHKLEQREGIESYFPLIEKYRAMGVIEDSSWTSKELFSMLDKKKALSVFGDLGEENNTSEAV